MKKLLTTGALFILMVALVLSVTGCSTAMATSSSSESSSIVANMASNSTVEPTDIVTSEAALSVEDGEDQWEEASATKIHLADQGIVIDGTGAVAVGSVVTISSGGVYVVEGVLRDGQIIISAPKTTTVHLILNGVTIQSSTSAAIYCTQAEKLIVTLAENTENTLTDASSYTYADVTEEEPDAALFSKVDLSLNGAGTLVVNGNFNNGIGSKDDLVITAGTYVIKAPNHGIRGRDSLIIVAGDFNITAGTDGLQSNNDTDVSQGWINLQGGTYAIEAGHDGIQAETTLDISGGTYQILTGAAGITDNATSDSYKGVKAGGNLVVSGGEFIIESLDDGVHSNGSIAISNATMEIASGDDGIHADGELTVSSGTIDITKSYEGIEASIMNLAGGEINIVSSDDGINVAGGTDDAGETTESQPQFGGDSFTANSNRWLYITGGIIHINAATDGIDVNGNTIISGGETYVSGPTGNGDGALDYDGTFEITGGTLVAAGSSGMALAPSGTSQQPSILVYFSSTQLAGTSIELMDEEGNILVQFAPEKEFQTAVLSAAGMELGGNYTILTDGTKRTQVVLEEVITGISDTGAAMTVGGMGGMGGGRGGMPGGLGQPPEKPAK